MTDLKPCPFCGGKPELHDWQYWAGPMSRVRVLRYGVLCTSCGVMFPADSTKEDAIKLWNRRTSE